MPARKSASATELRAILGDLDDATMAAIVATGATGSEVLEALQWIEDDSALEPDTGRAPHGPVRAVYEILRAEEPEEEP